MKKTDNNDVERSSGLFIGSEPLNSLHRRDAARKDDDGQDSDTGDDDSTDTGDSDGTDGGDTGDDTKDSDGKD